MSQPYSTYFITDKYIVQNRLNFPLRPPSALQRLLEPLYTRVHTPHVIRDDVSGETYQHVMREAYTYLHNVSELLFTAINMYIMLQHDDPLNTTFTTEKI